MNIEKIFNEFQVLESDRLVLKKIEPTDVNEVFEIYNNEKVFEFCGIIPKHNFETVSKMIGHFERDYNKRSRVKLGIFSKKEGKLLGIAEVMDLNQKVNMVTIGYFLAENHWGKGIAAEAVRILIKYLFDILEVNRIQAEVMPSNNASKKVLLKNGFKKEGVLRQASFWSGKGVVDLEVYGILRDEYIR